MEGAEVNSDNGLIRFISLSASDPKLFGFSEFLTGLALLVLAWTIADVQYKFRIKTAPLPLEKITFWIIACVGILTLLTDWWRAEEWLVPSGTLITPSGWQAFLGGLILLTFLTWAWFAFIQPPLFGKLNAKRYAQTLYRSILNGSPSELSVIATELTLSVKSLIHNAPELKYEEREGSKQTKEKSVLEAYANDILLLVADKRFCRVIVETSPSTALAIFREIGLAKKYGVSIYVFAKNIVTEALVNKSSFLYHEIEGYDSGLIGYYKPLSQALFSNYRMVETIGSLLDPDYDEIRKFDADQWEAYCRSVLITLRDYVNQGNEEHSFALYRAKGYLERATSDLYKFDGTTSYGWDADPFKRLQVIVRFINNAIDILNKKEVPKHLQMRYRKTNVRKSIYDYIAELIYELIFNAASIKSPHDLCWYVQHNSVWSPLFNFGKNDGPAAKVIKFKVRRLIYDDVAEMSRFPNFKGSKYLAFILNVLGTTVSKEAYYRDSWALQKAVLSWIKKNFAWLHSYNAHVAEDCLGNRMSYDKEKDRLVRIHPAEGLRREPQYVYFDIDKPIIESQNDSREIDATTSEQ